MSKFIRTTMPDDSEWDVPAEIVAHDRADYYGRMIKGRGEPFGDDRHAMEFRFAMDNREVLMDWAVSNMNWDDVEASAKMVRQSTQPVDYQDGWVNGEKQLVEVKA